MEEKKPRGGKREGAGRKPSDLKRYQVMLNDTQHDKAVELGKGNLSLGVRTALIYVVITEKQTESRPSNYNDLSLKEQWEIDKKLGLLDEIPPD